MSLSTRAAGRNKLVLGVDIGTTYSAVSFFVSTSDGKEPAFYEVSPESLHLPVIREPNAHSFVGQSLAGAGKTCPRLAFHTLVWSNSIFIYFSSLFQVQKSLQFFTTIIEIRSNFVEQTLKTSFVYSLIL